MPSPAKPDNTTLARLAGMGVSGPGFEVAIFSDEPKYPSWFIPTPAAGPYRCPGPYGLSLARSLDIARLKALAELHERICLHNLEPADERRSAWNGSGARPASFAAAPSEDLNSSSYCWLPARRIPDGEQTRVPAQVVLPNYDRGREPAILPKVGSSGCALGEKVDGGAWRRGLFEVMERHICSGFSIDTVRGPRIVDLPAGAAEIEDNLRRYRLEPFVFAMQNRFGIPCVAIALADASGVAPALSLAMRSARSWERAIEEGLLEALERRRPARLERSRGTPANPVYPWPTLDRLARARPAIEAAPEVPYNSLDEADISAEAILEDLGDKGLEVLLVDLTLPEVGAAGFEVARVLVPGLGPLPA